ncbi:MAG: hypothetical protein ABI197_07130 [Granulicella sp.]
MPTLSDVRDAKSPILFALLITLLLYPLHAHAQAATPCVLGYSVGFFNGVGNTESDAIDGRNALQAAIRQATGNDDDSYNDESVTYELYYNHTGSTVGASVMQDVAEVFIQRAQETDPSGFFSGNNFYLMWEGLSGQDIYGNTVAAAGNGPLTQFLQNFINSAVTSAVASISATFSNPPTADDYTTQNATLDAQAAAGRKFLLIAHSQGNLFINQAYNHIFPTIGSTRVKAVHIAPASTTINGAYLLSSNDFIINPLRLQGGATSVEPNNITIPISLGDKSGHTLVGTYLDETRNGYAAVTTLLTNGLGALAKGSCNLSVTPTATNLSPGGTVQLTATLNPVPTDGILGLGYSWTISGGVGGYFAGPSGNVTTINTTSPTITYNANKSAAASGTDTITVTGYAIKNDGSFTNAQALGTAAATATIKSDLSGWFGAHACPKNGVNYVMTISGAPFDPKYGVPSGTNLLAVVTNDINYGVSYYALYATSTTAIDTRALTNPIYTTAFTLNGGSIGGSFPAPCS